jgi:hypothetical protein
MKPLNEMTHIVTYEDVGKPFIKLEDVEQLIDDIANKRIDNILGNDWSWKDKYLDLDKENDG